MRRIVSFGSVLLVLTLVSCAGPFVESRGARANGSERYAVVPPQPISSPLPCVGSPTNIVIKRNGVGWNEDIANILGEGLIRRQCIWVETAQKPLEVRYTLVTSVFQTGDQVVANLELRDNTTGIVVASRRASHDHRYGWTYSTCGSVGCVYVTPREQVVSWAVGVVLRAAIEDL